MFLLYFGFVGWRFSICGFRCLGFNFCFDCLMVGCGLVSLVVLVTFGVSECLFVWVIRKLCWLVTCGIWLFRGVSC